MLCEQMSSLVQRNDESINLTKNEMFVIKQQFNALNLPEKQNQTLQRQFRDALNTVQKHLEDCPQREKLRQWQELSTLADICQQLEHGPTPELIVELQSRWQKHDNTLNKQLLADRYLFATSVAEGINLIDFNSTLQQRKKLCVQMEIDVGLDSPDEDKELRHTLQLNSLSRKFNQAVPSNVVFGRFPEVWWTSPSAQLNEQATLNQRASAVFLNSTN
jgi:hypothetical protein